MGTRTGNPEWKDHPDTSTLVTACSASLSPPTVAATVRATASAVTS